jgi:hypothetical protein
VQINCACSTGTNYKTYCGNLIVGKADAVFDAQGRIEFRNITAEVDRGDDADPLRFEGDGTQA